MDLNNTSCTARQDSIVIALPKNQRKYIINILVKIIFLTYFKTCRFIQATTFLKRER